LLPIRDLNPSRRTPIFTFVIVVACVLSHLAVQTGEEHFYEAASIPCEVTTGEPLSSAEIFREAPCSEGDVPVYAGKNIWFSVLASIFFHGGIGHLISNLWVLFIFGNNVEDAFGHLPYLAFYLLAGLVASGAHILLQPLSTLPVVGASGAIAGVMGAYAVLFPRARVTSIIPPFFFWPFALPAMVFLGIWFLSQFLLVGGESNIAWEAHVAGFVFGVLVAAVGRKRLKAHSTAMTGQFPLGRRVYR
jgi:membrane associated rhomboid family serine protease